MNHRRPLTALVGVLIILGSIFFSSTLAGTITLGENRTEFGQGVLLVTNCDSTIYAQPKSETATAGGFRLKGIAFWDINTSASGCNGRDLIARIYGDSGPLDFFGSTSEVRVRVEGGTFYSATSGVTLFPIGENGFYEFEIDNPELDAFLLKRVTLESLKAADPPSCNVTPTVAGGETTYTFTSYGVCIFTSPVTRPDSSKTARVTVVAGSGGGTNGTAGQSLTNQPITLTENAKYLVLVGRGGFVGFKGQTSSAFGVSANPGTPQANTKTGSAGDDGSVVLRYQN